MSQKTKHSKTILCFIILFIGIIIGTIILFLPKIKNFFILQTYSVDAFSEDSQSGYSTLNDEQKKAYRLIVKNMDEYQTSIDFSGIKILTSDMQTLYNAIMRDHPEYFWVSQFSVGFDSKTNLISKLEIETNCSVEERQQKQEMINAAVITLEKDISPEMDDYQKVKAVHDAIIKSTSYGYDSSDNQNICSVFIDGVSVCAGYSKAFQYILKDLGIFSTLITGISKNEAHAWNMVKMDGDYYFIDITWDDPSTGENELLKPVLYDYFGLTTNEILKDHTMDAAYDSLQICTATANQYFIRENLYFQSVDDYIGAAENAFSNGETQFYGKMPDGSMIDTALSIVQNRFSNFASYFSYFRNDAMGTLMVQIP